MWFQLTVTVTQKAKITENIAQLTIKLDLKLKSCIAVIAIGANLFYPRGKKFHSSTI